MGNEAVIERVRCFSKKIIRHLQNVVLFSQIKETYSLQ